MWRKVGCIPSGSGGKVTPKWEYFSACSFLKPVNDVFNEGSFQHLCETSTEQLSQVVFEGSLEDLLQDQNSRISPAPGPSSNSNDYSRSSNIPLASSPMDMNTQEPLEDIVTPEPPAGDPPLSRLTPVKKVRKTGKQLEPFKQQVSTHLGTFVEAFTSSKSKEKIPKPVFIAETLNSFLTNIPINRQKYEAEINAKVRKIIWETQEKISNELETQGN